MKWINTLVLGSIQFMLAANAGRLFAQVNAPIESFICRTNRSLLQNGAEWTLLTAERTLPGGIRVFTNGTFQVNGGKVRRLEEGQILRADGYLLNPDGSTMPVCDHVAMTGSNVQVFKDGDAGVLTATLTLPDGSAIDPDGFYTRPNGRRSRLVDGQLLTLEGASLGGLDTISLRSGKVVVYKAGVVIPVQSPEIVMGMYDGTRVRGDGFVTFNDGTTEQLAEGQTLLLEGVRADW